MARTPSPSAINNPLAPRPPKHARHAKQVEAPKAEPIDSTPPPAVQSGFSVFNPTPPKEHMMSQTDATKKLTPEEKAAMAEAKKAAAEAKAAEKAEAKVKKEAERAAKKAEAEAAKAAKAAEREAKKAERAAKLAELNALGPMAALRQAKANYVKSATGQLRSTDELANALDAVPPANVVTMGLKLLNLDANPYERLNIGQQSMNLRNKMRGAIKRGVLTIDAVVALRDSGGFALTPEQLALKRRQPKAEAQAATA